MCSNWFKNIAVSMPIKQNSSQHDLSLRHLEFLEQNYPNVETKIIELDNVLKHFKIRCKILIVS